MDKYSLHIFFSEEDGGYVADIPDLDSCSGFGGTPEQALAEVERGQKSLAGGGQGNRQAHPTTPGIARLFIGGEMMNSLPQENIF